jgi:hypothetical protein
MIPQTRLLCEENPMTVQTLATHRKRECKLTFRVEHRPRFLLLAIQGEATFDQAEVISAQLLRIPLDAYALVVLDLAELTFLSSLDMGALVEYRRGGDHHQQHPGRQYSSGRSGQLLGLQRLGLRRGGVQPQRQYHHHQ